MPATAELVAAPSTPTVPVTGAGHVRSQRATVANRSSHILLLVGYEGAGQQDDLPSTGTLVLPGENVQLEVKPQMLRRREVIAHFDVIQPHGNVLANRYRVAVSATRVVGTERETYAPELATRVLSPTYLVLVDA